MSNVSNGAATEPASQGSSTDAGPAKFTRHSTVIATLQPSSTSTATTIQAAVKVDSWKQEQSIFLLDMPQEVLEKIFSFLTFKTIAHLRPVSLI